MNRLDTSTVPLLQIEDLSLRYMGDEGPLEVLKEVHLTVGKGEITGLVGESGCGKSTLIKTVLSALPHNAEITSGRIRYEGHDILPSNGQAPALASRKNRFGFIPQDPYLSFNPLFTVGDQLLEIMRWNSEDTDGHRYNRAAKKKHRDVLLNLMDTVGLPDPAPSFDRYPHQFSGGQRQRLLIVGAMACSPSLIIADEPTTALDVTTQKGILALLKDLVDRFGVSILMVTHDLGVVAQLCDSVAIIEYGKIVETGPASSVLFTPQHDYTRRLLSFHPDRVGRLRDQAS